MGKKHKHEEHVNLERWLVSYADFVTLLFAFFVVMYATSQVDTKKMQQVVASIRGAMNLDVAGLDSPPIFDYEIATHSPNPPKGGFKAQAALESDAPAKLVKLKAEIEKSLDNVPGQRPPEDVVRLDVVEEGIRIRLVATYFFDQGSANLRPTAIPVVDAIAEVIAPLPNNMRVEGHSDSARGGNWFSNWEISSKRSLTVVRYLVQAHTVDPIRLAATAFANNRPIAQSETKEGRALNRRIDLFILNETPETKLD